MAKQKKFTFKNDPQPTGLSAVGNRTPRAVIKLNGKKVGWITPPSYLSNKCKVFFYVKKEPTVEDPAAFENVALSKQMESVQEMKEWLKEKTEDITAKLDLYSLEED